MFFPVDQFVPAILIFQTHWLATSMIVLIIGVGFSPAPLLDWVQAAVQGLS